MIQYRKRPIIVDAWQWDGDTPGASGCPDWITVAIRNTMVMFTFDSGSFGDTRRLRIDTPEGIMMAQKNDWIIKGINGEIYPCKPEIFEKTYDAIEKEMDIIKHEMALAWSKPMTSDQAQHYHLTCGFIAAELFDCEIRRRNVQITDRDAEISELKAKLEQVQQESFCARQYMDEARDWLRQIMSEAEDSPSTQEEWRDGLCRGSIEAVITQCKGALSEIPEGADVPFIVRQNKGRERA